MFALSEHVAQLGSQNSHIKFLVSSQVPSGHLETHFSEIKNLGEEQLVHFVDEMTQFSQFESQFLQVLSLGSAKNLVGQLSRQVASNKNFGFEQLVQVPDDPKQVVQGDSQFLQVPSPVSP